MIRSYLKGLTDEKLTLIHTPTSCFAGHIYAVQSLHLTFVVAAQHQRVLRGRHLQAHDLCKLKDKLRVARDLETARQAGLEPMFAPRPMHHGVTHTDRLGQLVSCIVWPLQARSGS